MDDVGVPLKVFQGYLGINYGSGGGYTVVLCRTCRSLYEQKRGSGVTYTVISNGFKRACIDIYIYIYTCIYIYTDFYSMQMPDIRPDMCISNIRDSPPQLQKSLV